VLTEAHEAEPAPPGTVVARPGEPLLLLAVVHDLAQDPTWREEWIGAALAGVLREVRARRVRALALPVLGARHGRMPPAAFAGLLRAALESDAPPSLARLWLQAAGETEELAAVLKAGGGAGGVLRRGPWPGSG
jgi:O-acetyl-ADP-ribose deacetylase (regulator of RNase III)